MEMNADHKEKCQCYLCLGKKLAMEMATTFQEDKGLKWVSSPPKADFSSGFFQKIRDEWFK